MKRYVELKGMFEGECKCTWLDNKHCIRLDLETCQALLKLLEGEELGKDELSKLYFVKQRLKGIKERFDV